MNKNFWMIRVIINIMMARMMCADYIRSDEITLEDSLETDAQIINLNRLMENEKANEKLPSINVNRNYVFKIVNDSSLVNYIELRYLNDETKTAVIILKKRLDYDDICEESSALRQSTCQQTLKIIAINENNFIEIPIEIKKVYRPRKTRAKVAFDRDRIDIKPNAISSSHLIDYPRIQLVQNPFQRDFEELISALDYSLSEMQPQNFVKVRIEKKLTGVRKLKISVQFMSESELLKAYELKKKFRFRLVVFLSPNMSRRFELINETSHSMTVELIVSVDDLNILNLKPLDFEYPIYSVSVENNEQNPLEMNDTILEPKLKSKPDYNNSIIFSLFPNEDSMRNSTTIQFDESFPFYVDEATGVVRLRKTIGWENELSNEKIFNFGIKASYRNLDHRSKSSYYNYMLPAYAKIQISLLSPNPKDLIAARLQVVVRSEILSPFVSKYEILNEESNNQTLILFINDPFSVNSKLIKLHVQKLIPAKRRVKSSQNYTLFWQLENYEAFFYDEKSTNLTLFNRVEFSDQKVYCTIAKLFERVSSQTERVLAEVNIQFRVDFDPLIFEKPEYMVHVTPYTFIGRNLIRIKLKNRLKSIINNNKHDNVTYRLAINHHRSSESDLSFFEIGILDGWLRARKELELNTKAARKQVYDLEIIAVNLDLQKSASVKCKIIASCDEFNEKTKTIYKVDTSIRYSLFDNSPNGTQIGIFKSICSDPNTYTYRLEPKSELKICSDELKCRMIDLPINSNGIGLFSMNPSDGYLMTNAQIKIETLLSLIDTAAYENEINQMNRLSVILSGSVPNLPLVYPIEIVIQNVPHLENFSERLYLVDRSSNMLEKHENENNLDDLENRCIFKYQFASTGVESLISRFVRVDKLSMTHLEPEFRIESTSPCSNSFFVYNNGCLAIKWISGDERRCVSLKTGEYKIEFKLCFYDTNKVSCSPLYNQTLIVDQDLSSTKIRALMPSTSDLSGPNRIGFDQKDEKKISSNLSTFLGSKRNGFSAYLLALFIVICVIALVALISFFFLFLRPRKFLDKKLESNASQTGDEKILVLSGKQFRNLQISTESVPSSATSSGSCAEECFKTREALSEKINSISKIRKADDDNDDIVKIQVTDDSLTKNYTPAQLIYQQNNHQNQIKYIYSGPNNFNYAGSFSSIGSSCDSSGNTVNGLINQQAGLYSVKTASIHFNQSHKMPSQQNQNVNILEENDKNLNSNAPLHSSLQSESILPAHNPQSNPNLKNSSLKKLKKDLAMRKQATTQIGQTTSHNVNSSFASSSSLLPTDDVAAAADSNSHIFYDYLSRKEVVLSPKNVIASVV